MLELLAEMMIVAFSVRKKNPNPISISMNLTIDPGLG